MSWDAQVLIEPTSEEPPCGKSLEDSEVLASVNSYELFGQSSLEPPKKEKDDPTPVRREPRKSDRPPNWGHVRDEAMAALRVSKDLRLLAHLGAAVLRTDGIAGFTQTLGIAAQWLTAYPAQVYPLVDEDALFRQNALNNFADAVAVIDGLRRAPLVSHRQHGRFSLRDLDLVSGQLQPKEDEKKPDEKQIDTAFEATPLEELKALETALDGALTSLGGIDAAMRGAYGTEFAPNFESLTTCFKRMVTALRAQLAKHPANQEVVAGDAGAAAGEGGGGAVIAVGSIRSRQDAIRALDAAAEFFRKNEPSSPIPFFVERAKRLVSKDFLEVLADVAPTGLSEAKTQVGQREEQV
jgi:type VI secretion system protein ImpA